VQHCIVRFACFACSSCPTGHCRRLVLLRQPARRVSARAGHTVGYSDGSRPDVPHLCVRVSVLAVAAHVEAPTPSSSPAADPSTATLYTSVLEQGAGRVIAFRWSGRGLVRLPSLDDAIHPTGARRPLAVVPPAPGLGRNSSYLVVGTQRASDIVVLRLPECIVVHRQALPGVRIMGLGTNAHPRVTSSVGAGASTLARPSTAGRASAGSGRPASASGLSPARWPGTFYDDPPSSPTSRVSSRFAACDSPLAGSSGFAEPTEQVLLVLDGASHDVLVFRWPLAGMPVLD
jgi:hypothetical protein